MLACPASLFKNDSRQAGMTAKEKAVMPATSSILLQKRFPTSGNDDERKKPSCRQRPASFFKNDPDKRE
jgi:hypothetical protein